MSYIGRFAPSPTGALHMGSLVAAMASYVDARAHGGRWLLRIEDVDASRARSAAARSILEDLARYGFQWDGEVTYQSQRTALYEDALSRLKTLGLVYPCTCSRQRLQGLPQGATGERIYDGKCRPGAGKTPDLQQPHAWRLQVPDKTVSFSDRACGTVSQNLARECGDFVVKRRDGFFAYHLAVVVDDAAQGVTHVVRGADLLPSTPRQIFLNELLGYRHPTYLHVPLVLAQDGEKLSKQNGATALPYEPLPTLKQAWQFLSGNPVPESVNDVQEFWKWAVNETQIFN
jgi:glutamyl-Q tRNA(Asp) synthetase